MDIDLVVEAERTRICLSGRFDYTTHGRFLSQAEGALAQTDRKQLWIDMADVEYIDSSALGMLLMLRDRARKEGKSVALVNVRGYTRDVIDSAQFNRLFDIH